MLPPQLWHDGSVTLARSCFLAAKATSSLVLRTSVASLQHRSFSWRRSSDWLSPTDPMYHRFHRIRTLRTRAKLLDKLRRRGKFEWDADQKPFFTPKHIRWASHWNYDPCRRRWHINDEPPKKRAEAAETAEENSSLELSQREKIWKEQMERLRKRIERDPYEAIFGKRFEPFWSPLVPSWMREEMGLQGWPKPKEASVSAKESSSKSAGKNISCEETLGQKEQSTGPAAPEAGAENQRKQPSTYSYASSTSWNSWENKTRRLEWDSVSNKTKQYEYDPISNRMVPLDAPKAAESVQSQTTATEKLTGSETENSSAKPDPVVPAEATPGKQYPELRKAIPIPPPLSQPSHAVPLDYTAARSLEKARSTSLSPSPSKPAALAKLPSDDIDLLTADDVRASMGKTKPGDVSTTPLSEQARRHLERDFDQTSLRDDSETDAILKGADIVPSRLHKQPEWDHAELGYILEKELDGLRKKKEKLVKDEHGLFHIERQSRELKKLDKRISEVTNQLQDWNTSRPHSQPSVFELARQRTKTLESERKCLETSIERAAASIGGKNHTSRPLQSSLERMQGTNTSDPIELDDSAAHESTEPLNTTKLPKEWSNQADLLQADRVRRATDKRPYPMPRWIDDMESRKAKYEAEKAERAAVEAERDSEKNARSEKANALLSAEVEEQKARMQAYEGRYAHKLQSLRNELDTSYKQSTVHTETHLERIQNLKQEVTKANKFASEKAAAAEKSANAYKEKIHSLRGELETAYKQSVLHSEKHLEHIRYLEQELEKAKKSTSNRSRISHMDDPSMKPVQAEGDFCPNITKFADSGKWYKRPAHQPSVKPIKFDTSLDSSELARELRDIYESRYGTIDKSHSQVDSIEKSKPVVSARKPRHVVEVESDVDLGEELALYEKEKQQYGSRANDFENEVAAQEREAHEAQRFSEAESGMKIKDAIVGKLTHQARPTPNDEARNSDESSKATGIKPEKVPSDLNIGAETGIQWADPPVYKVLAYDSGNDMFSTATTTSNLTNTETPIPIQQALSQLYQPARFVSHFAELQKEGYQVIYGTKDLLVFKKVKSFESSESKTRLKPTLSDHGLNAATDEGLSSPKGRQAMINPVDGTRAAPVFTKPSTGNFASPTGFVNHDPVFPSETEKSTEAIKSAESATTERSEVNPAPAMSVNGLRSQEDGLQTLPPDYSDKSGLPLLEDDIHDYDYRHYPRVRRQEEHFTGTTKAAPLGSEVTTKAVETILAKAPRIWNSPHHRHARREDRRNRKQRSKRQDRRLAWAVKTGLAAAVIMYLVGAAAEKSRQSSSGGRGEQDEWTRRAEEQRSRIEEGRRERS